MSNFLIFKAAFNNSATPAIGTYTAEGATARFNRNTSISPDYYLYNTAQNSAVQWFVPTKETTDFEFVADILTTISSGYFTYFIIADSTGTTRLRMWSLNYFVYFENDDSTAQTGTQYIGRFRDTDIGGFNVFHQFRFRVRKLTASSSSVEIYVDGTLKLTATAGAALVTCAKIGFMGGVRDTEPLGTRTGIQNTYLYDLSDGDVVNPGVLSGAFNRFISWMKSKFALKSDIPTVNNGTLTIQKNGTDVATFSANSSTNATANITVPTTLESLSTNSIPFHNAYPRCKYLGTTITDAQNTAIKNRTYDDLFIGDYWTINGVNWRIVAIDYYYNIGDTNFDKGNVIVMPDTALYNAQMNSADTTAGAYAGSLMRTQNLNSARTIAQNAFGSHLANYRIMLANAVDSSGPSGWGWYDSDGVELPNEVQIYGTRAWGSALKGYDVGTQKQQFPLMLFAPQFVNTRQDYWLQDVSSGSVSGGFADVRYGGYAGDRSASISLGVRPFVTLSYI